MHVVQIHSYFPKRCHFVSSIEGTYFGQLGLNYSYIKAIWAIICFIKCFIGSFPRIGLVPKTKLPIAYTPMFIVSLSPFDYQKIWRYCTMIYLPQASTSFLPSGLPFRYWIVKGSHQFGKVNQLDPSFLPYQLFPFTIYFELKFLHYNIFIV